MTTKSFAHSKITSESAQTFREYLFAFILSIFATLLILQLWKLHWLSIPFVYAKDSLYYAMTIKSLITTGWYLTDPSIGVPDGHFLGDFPTPEGLNYLLIKILSWFSSNWAVVFNLFFLLGFPLITLSALFVLRNFGLCYPFALSASLLFSFLPFHWIRGEEHVFLSAYYTPPLAIWLAVKLYTWEHVQKKEVLLSCFFCILIGSTGVYYAYFAAFFILLAALIRSYHQKRWQPLKYGTLFTAVICAAITANIWPTLIYHLKNGPNLAPIHRLPLETEMYGLKITQLLLPIDNDRIFSHIKQTYNTQNLLINENTTATLGLIASAGFLLLIAHLFLKRKETISDPLFDALAHFNLSAVLLATIGGFSSLIALFFLPQIRCYNRISVFIGFFALSAFFLLLQKKVKNSRWIWTLSILLLGIGLFNQSSPSHALASSMKHTITRYRSDQKFFQNIEERLPLGSRVFQLPHMLFPEGIAHDMGAYDHFKAPLHTHLLKWSFGAMRGRQTSDWQQQTSALEVPDMLHELIQKGFTGLYIDRMGYPDQGQSIELSLSQLLDAPPLIEGHRSFWDLRTLREDF